MRRATLSGSFSAGIETSEVQLFDLDDIPWDLIAFSSISTSLRLYCEDRKSGSEVVHHGQIQKKPGSAPGVRATQHLRAQRHVLLLTSMHHLCKCQPGQPGKHVTATCKARRRPTSAVVPCLAAGDHKSFQLLDHVVVGAHSRKGL